MEIIRERTDLAHLRALAGERFGDLVKAVVDVERGIMAVDAELHSDQEAALLDDGSTQHDLWGINLYPAEFGSDSWLEFDSMINVRPAHGNRSRSVEHPDLRARIVRIVDALVQR